MGVPVLSAGTGVVKSYKCWEVMKCFQRAAGEGDVCESSGVFLLAQFKPVLLPDQSLH